MDILNYKGFEITLDVNTGKFIGDGATFSHAKEFETTSLPSMKNKINSFIKENSDFGAFKVRNKYESSHSLSKLKDLTIIKGITSNKRLTIIDKQGKTGTIGKYDISRLVIYKEDDTKIIDECLAIQLEADNFRNECNKKINEKMNEIVETPLIDFLIESNIEVDMNESRY